MSDKADLIKAGMPLFLAMLGAIICISASFFNLSDSKYAQAMNVASLLVGGAAGLANGDSSHKKDSDPNT